MDDNIRKELEEMLSKSRKSYKDLNNKNTEISNNSNNDTKREISKAKQELIKEFNKIKEKRKKLKEEKLIKQNKEKIKVEEEEIKYKSKYNQNHNENNNKDNYNNNPGYTDETDPILNNIKNRIKANINKANHQTKFSSKYKIDNSILEKEYYKFRLLPWVLWIPGALFYILLFLLIFLQIKLNTSNLVFFFSSIFSFLMGTVILYSSYIEDFEINRKKQNVVYTTINIFCKKTMKKINYKDISHIEMIKKGVEKRGTDDTKYFVRISFYDPAVAPLEFGKTFSYDWIKHKYLVCLAMIKGIVNSDLPSYFLKDETYYEEYKINKNYDNQDNKDKRERYDQDYYNKNK